MDADINLLFSTIENLGDWRLWVNTNNTYQEWSMIFDEDCNDCIAEGLEDFGGLPWQTGDATSSHSLGPDILLFPFSHQSIWVHSSGYEDDYYEDKLGEVNRLSPQKKLTYSDRSDNDIYTLNFQISEGPPVGLPNLTFLGRQTYERYLIKSDLDQPTIPIIDVIERDWNHPDNLQLPIGSPPFNLADSSFFDVQEPERLSLESIPTDEFQKRIAEARREAPEALAETLTELREEMDFMLQQPEELDVLTTLILLKNALPADLWNQHFDDIDLDELQPPTPLFVPWWLLLLTFLITAAILLSLFLFYWRAYRKRVS